MKYGSHFFLVILISIIFFINKISAQKQNYKPIRLAIAGMSHGHLPFILKRPSKGDFDIVGFYETNIPLISKVSKQYKLSPNLIYHDLEKMLETVKPQAVVAFGSVFDHLAVVEACAPRGIHVMVEKPLAVSMEHAKRIAYLSKKYNIHVLTNYETSWYPTLFESFSLINNQSYIGNLKRVVINTGHNGPKELGCDMFFLEWLTDPVLNGGGAIVDFGCYGVNIITALTKGQEPISVSAVTRQFKPDIYPNVDDDATIIVSYPSFQCIIQASWNWTFSRKDVEIYGDQAYIKFNKHEIIKKNARFGDEKKQAVKDLSIDVYKDPFGYFGDVIHSKIDVTPFSLYSIENNLRVVKILELAKQSAFTGKVIQFK